LGEESSLYRREQLSWMVRNLMLLQKIFERISSEEVVGDGVVTKFPGV
jgi:hypothetical protein